MSAIIVLGDPHIGKNLSIGRPGLGSTLNSKIQDQLNILDWTLTQAINHQVNSIIITGDVFEEAKPHPTLVSLFISWLKKCTDNNVDVHICKGNHDIIRSGQYQMSAFDIISAAEIDGVFIYNDIGTVDLPGLSVSILPFRDRRSFNTNVNSEAIHLLNGKIKYEAYGINKYNMKIAVGHFALVGSLPVGDEVDDMHNELFCPLEMFNQYDYTFMGHIHKPQIMSKNPFISHIGSMDLSNFGEATHDKIIAVIDTENNSPMKFLEIPCRPLKQISISVPVEITDTTDYIIQSLKSKDHSLNRAIVKMHISYENSDAAPIDRPLIEEAVMKLGAFHIPRIDQERKVGQVKKTSNMESVDNTVNEITAIKMFAEENIEDNFRNDFISLANETVKETKELNATN